MFSKGMDILQTGTLGHGSIFQLPEFKEIKLENSIKKFAVSDKKVFAISSNLKRRQ